jgi:hypothetical protein
LHCARRAAPRVKLRSPSRPLYRHAARLAPPRLDNKPDSGWWRPLRPIEFPVPLSFSFATCHTHGALGTKCGFWPAENHSTLSNRACSSGTPFRSMRLSRRGFIPPARACICFRCLIQVCCLGFPAVTSFATVDRCVCLINHLVHSFRAETDDYPTALRALVAISITIPLAPHRPAPLRLPTDSFGPDSSTSRSTALLEPPPHTAIQLSRSQLRWPALPYGDAFATGGAVVLAHLPAVDVGSRQS